MTEPIWYPSWHRWECGNCRDGLYETGDYSCGEKELACHNSKCSLYRKGVWVKTAPARPWQGSEYYYGTKR